MYKVLKNPASELSEIFNKYERCRFIFTTLYIISGQMNFDKYIKVTKVKYSYTELELLAEFGGYVGLFLGISVFHLSEIIEKIINYQFP